MRVFITSLILMLTLAPGAVAEPELSQGSFSHIELHHVGTMKGNYQTGNLLTHMSDGVKLTFVAKDAAENLHVESETVDFTYANKEDSVPSHIVLKKKVMIRTLGNLIRADKAEIDFETGLATFTGNAQMDTEAVHNLQASSIKVNLNTGDFEVLNAVSERVDITLGEKKTPDE